jgi:glycosyltransferase involved in cell wall biosynthesis
MTSIFPKICLVTETYYPVMGGGETQARAMAEALTARGFAVIVLTRRSHAALLKTERFGDVTAYRLPPVGPEYLKKWGLLLSSLPALIRLRRHYDLIFVSGFRVLGLPAVLISKCFGKVCILKADSPGEMSGKFFTDGLRKLGLRPSSSMFKAFLWLRNTLLKRADAFVAISSEISRELTTNGVSPDIIHMIPNSVDTHRFCPVSIEEKRALRQKLGLPLCDQIVVYCGRLVSYKGLPLLVQVWQEVQRKHKNIRLVLVGSGELDMHNCEAELRAYVNANGLENSIRFAGKVGNVHEYLQASDIFVFPTEREAFGIALIEAMACGLPVISTPVGGVKDILQCRQNGLVVQAGDFQHLYEALDMLITNSSLSSCLGNSARQTVQDRYAAEIVFRKYLALFHHVAKPSGPLYSR